MKCPRCHRELRDGVKYCTVCGAKVEQPRHRIGTILLAIVILVSITVSGGAVGIALANDAEISNPLTGLFSGKSDPKETETDETVEPVEQDEQEQQTEYASQSSEPAETGETLLETSVPQVTWYESDTSDDASGVPGPLSDEQLRQISITLGVPEDLDTRIEQGEPTYWEGGDMYRTMVEIYDGDEFIAGASVESETGGLAGSITVYSGTDDLDDWDDRDDWDEAEPQTVLRGYVSNADGGLNVRQNPSTTAACVRRIYNGEPVTITEQVTAEGMNWGHISCGWICTNYVTFEDSYGFQDDFFGGGGIYMVSPSAGAVNVRSGPGTSYQSLRRVGTGVEIPIYEQTTAEGRTWGKTDVGWVCMDYLISYDYDDSFGYGYDDYDDGYDGGYDEDYDNDEDYDDDFGDESIFD